MVVKVLAGGAMKERWLRPMVVALCLIAFTAPEPAEPVVWGDELASVAAPPRVRGFNTAQLLDWLDDNGDPVPGAVSCPAPTDADPGRTMPMSRIDCALSAMAASGAAIHRLIVFWSDVQPHDASQWNWTKYDALLARGGAVGIDRVILTPVGSPNWARIESRRTEPMGPFSRYAYPSFDHLGDWREFVTRLAGRYDPDGFEIGNEQNTNNFWDATPTDQPPSPAGYTRLFCAASQAIHGVRPAERVGVGGLAPILVTVLDPTDTSDKRYQASAFLRRGFASGLGRGACRVDFVGYHPYLTRSYCGGNPRVGRTPYVQELARVREQMTRHGHASRKVWITEWGFPSENFGNCTQYTPARQASLVQREHNYLARLPYTAFSVYFNLVDDDTPTVNGSIGLLCNRFTAKPAYNSWRRLIPTAPGPDPPSRECLGEE
jgi:hypothetical protein